MMREINIGIPGIKICRLAEEHLDDILRLMNREGWYYYDQHELRRYIAMDQDCFTMIRDGCVSGCIFTTNFANQAWIGNVVIAAELRSKGVGASMLRAVMAWLEENRAIHTFRLGSVPLAIGVYKKVGFHAESFTSSQEAELPLVIPEDPIVLPENVHIERLTQTDLDEIAGLDARFFGSNRRQLLDQLLADSIPEASFALKANGVLEGFLMVRRRTSSKTEAGFAEGPDHVYRVGPSSLLPKHGIHGFKALLRQAMIAVNREASALNGSARVYIVFPKEAQREVIYRETHELAKLMGMDSSMNLDAVFDEHEQIFSATPSSKCEQQWHYLEGMGFHQEYFEQVMVCTNVTEGSRIDPEGIFALATPGDKG